MQEPKQLGIWLETAREKAGTFKILLYVVLAALVGSISSSLMRPNFPPKSCPDSGRSLP